MRKLLSVFGILVIAAVTLVGCGEKPCSVQAEEYLAEHASLWKQWNDAYSIASDSSSMAMHEISSELTEASSELQEIILSLGRLKPPACAKDHHLYTEMYMVSAIETWQAFVEDDADMMMKNAEEVSSYIKLIGEEFEKITVTKDDVTKTMATEVPPRPCTPEGYLLKVEDDVNELVSISIDSEMLESESVTIEVEPLPDEYRNSVSHFARLIQLPVLECEELTHGYLLDALDYWEQAPQILFSNRREGWEIKSQFYFMIGTMKFEVWQESVLHISDE